MQACHALLGISLGLPVAAWLASGCAKDQDYVDQHSLHPTPPGVLPDGTQIGPKPDFGPTRVLEQPPPAISGGTLIVASDGRAVASDPDRDLVYIVDVDRGTNQVVTLQAGDEPGRLAEDANRRVHVALRRGGALLTIDLSTGRILARRQICGAPRGVAYDAIHDTLVVACATGELVTLPAGGGAPLDTVQVERDLRDVILVGSDTFVSRFRTAEIVHVAFDGTILERVVPPSSESMDPAVAWRLVPVRTDTGTALAMVHQRGRSGSAQPVSTQPGGYGESSTPGCQSSIVESTISWFDAPSLGDRNFGQPSPVIPAAVLPVDMAASPDGNTLAVVAAGSGKTPTLPGLFLSTTDQFFARNGGCSTPVTGTPQGQATAVAFDAKGRLFLQTREPAQLYVVSLETGPSFGTPIVLSSQSVEDTGHSIFHSNAGGFVACASCHAEGGEDGRVWTFDSSGGRRTQSLRGTIAGTAPYHWSGDMANLTQLSHEVFVKRMAGDELSSEQIDALQRFVFTLPQPAIAPPADQASVNRGQALFNDSSVGCTSCHAGAKFTNNQTVDVGTGGAFQVPSLLGVAWRAPYLHNGCAQSLEDRFAAPCGGGDSHGHTSQLSPAQVEDLVAFLKTL